MVYKSVKERRTAFKPIGNAVNKDFRLSLTAVARLKADASSKIEGEWISSSDSVNALLWRANVKARIAAGVIKPDDHVEYWNAVEFRSKLPRPLPSSWLGNAFLAVSTEKIAASELLVSGGLAKAAQLIRRSIASVDAALIKSFIYLTKTVANPMVSTLHGTLHHFFSFSSSRVSNKIPIYFYRPVLLLYITIV